MYAFNCRSASCTHLSLVQAHPPKFMYAKSEIMRRREAVGINVRMQLLLQLCLG